MSITDEMSITFFFFKLLILIFGMLVLLLLKVQKHISLAFVNILPKDFNTNIIPYHVQLKPT